MDLSIETFVAKIRLYFPDLDVELCYPRGNPEAIHAILIWKKRKRIITVIRHFSGTFRVAVEESPDWNMIREMDYQSALAKVRKICKSAKTTSK